MGVTEDRALAMAPLACISPVRGPLRGFAINLCGYRLFFFNLTADAQSISLVVFFASGFFLFDLAKFNLPLVSIK